MNNLQHQLDMTDKPTAIQLVSTIYDPDFPPGWFVVFPRGTMLDATSEDNAIACFKRELHATEFSKRWGQFVAIIQNGEDT